MNYKGFVIEPVYRVGSTFRILPNDRCVDRKPTSKDIEYYRVIDPMTNDFQAFGEDSITGCKQEIDRVLHNIGMKSNLPKEWTKLNELQVLR